MTKANRRFVRSVTVMAAMLLVACATPNYIPDKNAVNHMSVGNARHIVENYIPHSARVGRGETVVQMIGHVSGARVTPSGITIQIEGEQSVVIPFKDVRISVYGTSMTISDDIQINLFNLPADKVNDIASAFFVLTRSGSKLRAMNDVDLHFDATAKAYRAASPKPALPEAARRFKVQAEGAVNDKQFENAADYYEQAIEVAPWWPEGHFNRALVLGETKEFDLAILEMKRYLALVPDAPDARAAQDKIYDWERKTAIPN